MLPIRDENPSHARPLVSYSLIAINIVIFILGSSSPELMRSLITSYSFIPSASIERPIQSSHRLIASTFLHAGWIHLLGNILYLSIFGDNVEAAFGHVNYLIFYLFSGISANFTHMIVSGSPGMPLNLPTVGASGAISGILGAYLIFYPRARIITVIFLGYLVTLRPIPAKYFLLFWFILQLISGALGEAVGVAYWAHIRGSLTGIMIALPYRFSRRDPLGGHRFSG